MGILAGLNVVITGGSHGIGEAIVKLFAKEGAKVLFTYCRDRESAERIILSTQTLAVQVDAYPVNLSKSDELQVFIEMIHEMAGGIDIFINNAGVITRHSDFLDIDKQSLDFVMDVNLKAPFLLTQAAAKNMIKHGNAGKIINISSMSAEIISKGLAHYECSKAALNRLTKSSASALAQYGICVNAIAPGLVATHMNEAQRSKNAELWYKRCEKIPLGRAGEPQDIANLALYLSSPSTSWVTGSIMSIDGGQAIQCY